MAVLLYSIVWLMVNWLQQSGVRVIKKADGKLEYQLLNNTNNNFPVTYNTMRTPKGGQYQLRLPDGARYG